MRVGVQPGAGALPLNVDVSGADWRRQLVVTDARGAEVAFPSTRHGADVVEVRLSGKGAARGRVHLGFRCGERAARR
jgi:hypothetical protein